jgi:2-keto-4-pentenoate hydratase
MAQELDDAAVSAAAARLAGAWNTGEPCAPVRDLLGLSELRSAYAVQDKRTRTLLDSGRRLVGRKIGLTSLAVQRQLGVDQPDYGMLFDDMDVPLGETIAWGRVHQPKIEAEIAFVLSRDLDDPLVTSAEALAAVDYAVPALEIVGSRIAGWDIRITDTIADNASSGLFVIGHTPKRLTDFDVVAASMNMEKGGATVSTGTGAACLGSPVSALLWLARVMATHGRPLRAGDLVLSGALGPMATVQPGDRFEARIEGLGSVSAHFGGGE